MKIIVAGPRDFDDKKTLFKELDRVLYRQPWDTEELPRFVQMMVGDAPGADTIAQEWAYERHLTYQIFHADWKTHGKSAGPIRNREMVLAALEDPGGCEAVLFFGGVGTRETVNLRDLLLAKGVKVTSVGSG